MFSNLQINGRSTKELRTQNQFIHINIYPTWNLDLHWYWRIDHHVNRSTWADINFIWKLIFIYYLKMDWSALKFSIQTPFGRNDTCTLIELSWHETMTYLNQLWPGGRTMPRLHNLCWSNCMILTKNFVIKKH